MVLSPLNFPASKSTSSGHMAGDINLPMQSTAHICRFLAGFGRVLFITFGNISHWVFLHNTHWVVNPLSPFVAGKNIYLQKEHQPDKSGANPDMNTIPPGLLGLIQCLVRHMHDPVTLHAVQGICRDANGCRSTDLPVIKMNDNAAESLANFLGSFAGFINIRSCLNSGFTLAASYPEPATTSPLLLE
jgi:hypothetical protein